MCTIAIMHSPVRNERRGGGGGEVGPHFVHSKMCTTCVCVCVCVCVCKEYAL